jgi:predicted short-subunit dehydrogenase-like oxidoreductase (DUF2520 family)
MTTAKRGQWPVGERHILPVAVYGAGTVGTTLAVALEQAGYAVVGLASRSLASAQRAAELLQRGRAFAEPVDLVARARVLFVTTGDDALAPAALALLPHIRERSDLCLIHCSGALAAEVLVPAGEEVAYHVAGMHPLQAFASVEAGLRNLPGTYWGVEGPGAVTPLLEAVVRDLAGRPLLLAPGGKALYHAAACLASNYLVTLLDMALRTTSQAGIEPEEARQALTALARGTLCNLEKYSPEEALTGPIARGDGETLERHLAAYGPTPEGDFYRLLGRYTVELAGRRKLGAEAVRRLQQILDLAVSKDDAPFVPGD